MKALAFAQAILRQYEGGDVSTESGFDERDVLQLVYDGWALAAANDARDDYRSFGEKYIDPDWLEDFTVDVVHSDDYATAILPQSPLYLFTTGGIQAITRVNAPDEPFMPMTRAGLFVFATLPKEKPFYVQTSTNLTIYNLPTATTQIVVTMIPSRPDNIPDEKQGTIRDYVIKQLNGGVRKPEDKLTNQNPNDR